MIVLVMAVAAAAGQRLDEGGWSSYGNGVAIAVGLAIVATLFVLINGPEPRWATRWAWFWLIMSPALVVTLPLFLIGSGPQRPWDTPTEPIGRRLTGGWAFLIAALVLGSFRLRS